MHDQRNGESINFLCTYFFSIYMHLHVLQGYKRANPDGNFNILCHGPGLLWVDCKPAVKREKCNKDRKSNISEELHER